MASRERLELPPRVLETRMLPLHQRDTIMVDRNGIEPFLQACKARVPPTTPTAHNFQRTVANACIKAHCHHHHSSASYGRYVCPVCFNTLGFFTHYKKCFSSPRTPSFAILKCCRLALPCTKRKTPGFLVPGSFCIL
jgi:hypothetical protein